VSNKTIQILYGRSGLSLSVPAAATILQGGHATALPDPAGALQAALERPIGSAPLLELLRRRSPKSVAITISDITRPVPNKLILPALFKTIATAGIHDDQVVILIATGMHRPSTPAEREELVGADILRRCAVIDHVADNVASLVRVSDDPPVSLNRHFVEAGFRIVTGLIEPHFMAGYSGGRKGVCPGLVDLATVQRFHNYKTLADPRSDTGVLEGNPCHAEALRVARKVGVDFLVNVALDGQRRIAGVYGGDMEQAHAAGCGEVARWNSAVVDKPFDLVITSGGGYPLDQTFYQTVKGMVGALPALHPRSVLLIASAVGEGIGSPQYTQVMKKWGANWRGFLTHISGSGGGGEVVKDQWQYQMHARVLERIGHERLWMVSDGLPFAALRELAVTPLDGGGDPQTRCQRAIDSYVSDHPEARIAVIPDGPYTMLRRV
jgi:nickel-dependent lactate racemase